jgi:hypothetical protein
LNLRRSSQNGRKTMGATFFYDAMHPIPRTEAEPGIEPERQVEVYRHAGDLFLRLGPVGRENAGTGRYTARLAAAQAAKLAKALEEGLASTSG